MDKELVSQMKKLAALGKERGAVVPVNEAFKMFPVEEESHKGESQHWKQGDKKVEM